MRRILRRAVPQLGYDKRWLANLPIGFPGNDGEPRWQTIGMVNGIHVLLVAHTLDLDERDDDEEVIRTLSARRATRRERRIYAQGI